MKFFKNLSLAALAALSLTSFQPSARAEAPAGQIISAPVRLKVLSLNVWGLPAPIGTDLDQRMERIGEAIKDYDIVLLQETFDHRTE
ncbi:MAG: hypothetical protein ACAI44_09640, partial [Candidatus Sericytochromatia bacterium]